MKKSIMRGFGIFYMLVLVIMLLWYVNKVGGSQSTDYTYLNFLHDVETGNVAKVVISQNSEVPTGSMIITTKAGREVRLFVSDVNEINALLCEKNIPAQMEDVERESFL